MQTKTLKTDVLIVGAGPVGLTLAMTLAARGLQVLVAEQRQRGEPPEVKCNHISARSMEVLRRLGVAAKLRAAGLPEDYPNDISYRTTTTGTEITRIRIPCRRDRYTDTSGPDGWWPTPEPPHRINQLFIEPIMFAHAEAQPGLTILNSTRIEGFEQSASEVFAQASDLASGESFAIEARYLVGCDGGRSAVRKAIGASLVGDAVVQRVQSSYIRAPGLIAALQSPPAWAMFSLNPVRSGNIYAIDGRETWLVHNYLRDDEPDFESVDRDWALRAIMGVGPDFEFNIISKEDWFGRRLVADKFRDRRVFICGDAAHLWVPYAGYGMNAGIADAENLGWLLAARLLGWGGEGVLDAYEAERLPITEQVSRFAMNHAHEMARRRRAVPAGLDGTGPEAEALRAQVGQDIYDLNVQQYCCAGLNFGYYYDNSPLIAYDGEAAPEYGMGSFTPSTAPGCRVPHLWLDDGRSLYDALGQGYALLRGDPGMDVQALLDAAAAKGVPLALVDLPARDRPTEYRHKLLLARPDGQVAWRGDSIDAAQAKALIATVRGAAQ
ncbi:FAD-dependent oxidoreductase [Roseateles toxinivorans]|uniref:2-polyprenyl-6-methoxyphenol hydroxylase-like FAD-dependent oxidoreductase n=1 Tax=Roseateles toxinivorans TaxID=270368 RepID=A0A4R6QHJ7_9BURK|nr:FAD-dependent oxidoreductase [Roseateles toxinivorans]TDP61863.1 2-polyprenyl-6-methoxyphenol hydroxylase-like FAD-dependent oxidoreductase [Roseateles toxinivorans]